MTRLGVLTTLNPTAETESRAWGWAAFSTLPPRGAGVGRGVGPGPRRAPWPREGVWAGSGLGACLWCLGVGVGVGRTVGPRTCAGAPRGRGVRYGGPGVSPSRWPWARAGGGRRGARAGWEWQGVDSRGEGWGPEGRRGSGGGPGARTMLQTEALLRPRRGLPIPFLAGSWSPLVRGGRRPQAGRSWTPPPSRPWLRRGVWKEAEAEGSERRGPRPGCDDGVWLSEFYRGVFLENIQRVFGDIGRRWPRRASQGGALLFPAPRSPATFHQGRGGSSDDGRLAGPGPTPRTRGVPARGPTADRRRATRRTPVGHSRDTRRSPSGPGAPDPTPSTGTIGGDRVRAAGAGRAKGLALSSTSWAARKGRRTPSTVEPGPEAHGEPRRPCPGPSRLQAPVPPPSPSPSRGRAEPREDRGVDGAATRRPRAGPRPIPRSGWNTRHGVWGTTWTQRRVRVSWGFRGVTGLPPRVESRPTSRT